MSIEKAAREFYSVIRVRFHGRMPDDVREAYLRLGDALALPEPQPDAVARGDELIAAERARQISKEGWSAKHDEAHKDGSLATAAACYAMCGETVYRKHERVGATIFQDAWPWERRWDKRGKHDAMRSLVIAGALIAAEIDRLLAAKEKRDAV